jgi:hypothetical protein
MSTEGSTSQDTAQQGLLLRAGDGSAYVIPHDALEKFRLSDEALADLEAKVPEARLPASAGDDVEGFEQYIGQFRMTTPGNFWGYYFSWYDVPWSPSPGGYPGLH